jgi:predicted dehydrogenase
MIRLGLIGCGNVTENRHLPALQQVSGIEVVAVTDTDERQLNKVADRFHIKKRYTGLSSILDDSNIDAVGVITPVQFHAEMAMEVMIAGKHLFLEKPLSMRLDQADELVEKAAQTQCKAMLGYNLRWHPFVSQAREIIRSGSLGDIETVLSVSTTGTRFNPKAPVWMNRRESGGGVLFEYSSHFFDLWRFLFDVDVEQVFAVSRSDEWDDVSAAVNTRMANGMPVTSAFSEATATNKEIQIYGQKGSLSLSLYRFDGLRFIPKSNPPGGISGRLQEILHTISQIPNALSNRKWGGIHNSAFLAEWQHFAECIQRNINPACTFEDGRKALKATLAAMESASAGKLVHIPGTTEPCA